MPAPPELKVLKRKPRKTPARQIPETALSIGFIPEFSRVHHRNDVGGEIKDTNLVDPSNCPLPHSASHQTIPKVVSATSISSIPTPGSATVDPPRGIIINSYASWLRVSSTNHALEKPRRNMYAPYNVPKLGLLSALPKPTLSQLLFPSSLSNSNIRKNRISSNPKLHRDRYATHAKEVTEDNNTHDADTTMNGTPALTNVGVVKRKPGRPPKVSRNVASTSAVLEDNRATTKPSRGASEILKSIAKKRRVDKEDVGEDITPKAKRFKESHGKDLSSPGMDLTNRGLSDRPGVEKSVSRFDSFSHAALSPSPSPMDQQRFSLRSVRGISSLSAVQVPSDISLSPSFSTDSGSAFSPTSQQSGSSAASTRRSSRHRTPTTKVLTVPSTLASQQKATKSASSGLSPPPGEYPDNHAVSVAGPSKRGIHGEDGSLVEVQRMKMHRTVIIGDEGGAEGGDGVLRRPGIKMGVFKGHGELKSVSRRSGRGRGGG